MRRWTCAAIALAAALGAASAGSLNLDFNDESARLGFGWPVGSTRLIADADWLHAGGGRNVGSLGLHVAGEMRPDLSAGVGGRVLYVDAGEGFDGGAVAIGGHLLYRVPAVERLELGGRLYYAPDALAFGSATQYGELSADVGYRVVAGARLYVGYRYVRAKFDDAPRRVTVDSSVHFGIGLEF